MVDKTSLSKALLSDMKQKGVDVDLALSVLDRINQGKYESGTVAFSEIPDIDDRSIVDIRGEIDWRLPRREAEEALEKIEMLRGGDGSHNGEDPYEIVEDSFVFRRENLRTIGVGLLPTLAFGLLNGGSATSYADILKNEAFSRELFDKYKGEFEEISDPIRGRSKGTTPAYINSDGSPGPSYIELKLRGLLLKVVEYGMNHGRNVQVLNPLFQMTSFSNNDEVVQALESYRSSAILAPLIENTGVDITQTLTAIQPLIVAYTHQSEGIPRRVFDTAFGNPDSSLPLPGGHGQLFVVLRDVLSALHKKGKRYIQISNVDNIAATVDPVELAILALSGRPGGFDFSHRTPVDVKGGVLVRQLDGSLTCADLGAAIGKAEVNDAEKQGKSILFNCATGLFDLSYLLENLDRIVAALPLRLSEQEKGAGRYSQAEQITWEVIGLLKDPIIFAVDKYNRFLAAKLLVESMLTSGLHITDPDFPTSSDASQDLLYFGQRLHQGLIKLLKREYGMRMVKGRWEPRPVSELFSPI